MSESAALDAIRAELRAAAARRELANVVSVKIVLPLDRPAPVDAYAGRPRPPAFSREPCVRCGTRGEIGCAHQAPYQDRPQPAPQLVDEEEEADQ